jgi:class 3 adenylate cyclase/tetratricopeptide (TPR) repeat protein
MTLYVGVIMKCPKCQFENPESLKFCGNCGAKTEIICPKCKVPNPAQFKFCGECGYDFTNTSAITNPQPIETPSKPTISDQERKHVTVMFSDLSGYTAMTEKLDPEEVKEIMDRIFGKISQVVVKYEGFIEKFVGDAVMAIFGVPKTHEDDPVRAIRAAREIHNLVKEISPTLDKTIGRPLYMHTGINTGLVVAKEIDFDKGTHGVLGDTINVTSRISGLAKTDEIIVGLETYHQAEGYFNFEKLDPTKVKGKEEPIHIYKVLSTKETVSKTHRLSGLRAELIGRKVEMEQLKDAVENLKQDKSSIFSIIGDAGSGKSRLVEEFRKSLDREIIQWREGHCYGYSQNSPYFPLIDLLSRAWQIKEGEPPDKIRQKIESGAKTTLGERKDLIPYIGNLYSLTYAEIEQIPPEQFKLKLHEAIKLILTNLCQHATTIICLEDLHWADPSAVEFLRNILIDLKYPVIFLCTYRPSFGLFTSHQADSMKYYHEIRLQQLSPTDAQSMVESLLKTKTIPRELQQFVRNKAEGNPFYLEEVINSLIETDTLIQKDDTWKLTRILNEKDIPSTIQGVISARLDRLERESKRILQEASVIGRTFLYEILKRISDLKEYIDKSLINMERLDLIKTISMQPEMEYIFKHALTQEVVYNGLLIKERRKLHEKIAQVMEELFHDRLNEFYETLAYHYAQSDNAKKACEYLKLSGDKAAKNYANNEALRFYKEALRLLDSWAEDDALRREKVELLLRCHVPLFLLGYPQDSIELLQRSEKFAQALGDQRALAHFHRGLSLCHTLKGDPSLGEQYGEKCFHEAALVEDMDLVVQSADQLCFAYFMQGNMLGTVDVSRKAIDLFERHSLDMSLTTGGLNVYALLLDWHGGALVMLGHFEEAKIALEKGNRNAREFNDWFQLGMGMMNLCNIDLFKGDGTRMIAHARELIQYYEKGDTSLSSGVGWSLLGVGYFLQGDHLTARNYVEKGLSMQKESGMNLFVGYCEWFLSVILLEIGDLRMAREHCEESLRLAKEARARHIEGIAFMLLGAIAAKEDLSCYEVARNTIQQGLSILEELQLIPSFAWGCLFLGELYADAGLQTEALETFKKTESLYLNMRVPRQSYWLTRIEDTMKKLRVE